MPAGDISRVWLGAAMGPSGGGGRHPRETLRRGAKRTAANVRLARGQRYGGRAFFIQVGQSQLRALPIVHTGGTCELTRGGTSPTRLLRQALVGELTAVQ